MLEKLGRTQRSGEQIQPSISTLPTLYRPHTDHIQHLDAAVLEQPASRAGQLTNGILAGVEYFGDDPLEHLALLRMLDLDSSADLERTLHLVVTNHHRAHVELQIHLPGRG
ncbi:MAG: hypothetical protein AAGF95_35630 [Chloroflexota bacterium]